MGNIPTSSNRLYKVKHLLAAAATIEQVDILIVYYRLGHISANTICSLIHTNVVTGLHLIDPTPTFPLVCNLCNYAKTICKPICEESPIPLAESFGNKVYLDVWGPSKTSSLDSHKYYITFTNDHTHFTQLVLLYTKDEALPAYKTFAAWASTQHGAKIKHLRSDCRGEYTVLVMSLQHSSFQGTE